MPKTADQLNGCSSSDSARSYIPELARAPYTTVYILPFGYMAQTCSIYFTVAAAFDCFVNVRLLEICVQRSLYDASSKADLHYSNRRVNHLQFVAISSIQPQKEQIIEICPTTLFFTINMVYNVYMYMVLMTLLPFLFLLCLNAVIVLRQSLEANKQKEVSKDSSDSLLKPAAKTSSGDDTITMIMALVVNLIETFFDPDPLLLNLLSDASNFLVILNSSVNSVIYFVFNKEYREIAMTKLHRMIDRMSRKRCCCCCRLCVKRRDHQDPTYHPVANGRDNGRPPSLRCVVSENNADTVTTTITPASPVWQPLTQRNLPNMEWPLGSFDPMADHMTLMDDETSSGWEDGGQEFRGVYAKI
ncbi:hypothetical protein TELCIR_06029 [Teladorsagia circumcincta]|uniref:G-protein coupled receptors family 1 profile domain-containing protein n=1 Tax=Teladorsagia circumcincta TaxID=45464 RepID=A0A2G9UP90_TELCI|nr:hypothetical protein TELCIR_06029 [Teladorsagia circumcincta]